MDVLKQYNLEDLVGVMKALRTPESGCPWDLVQSFKTIIPYTLEEAYEVADAIDRNDMKDLREELGDLLFQSVYHAQMASEDDQFDLNDVIHDVTHKMISRHPHVFGDADAKNASDVDAIWDMQKSREGKTQQSALDGVTNALPALLKAQKLQKKAAKVGFEWPDVTHVLDKLEEEIKEMREAVAQNDLENQAEELGDILFLLANYGRMLGINTEEALRQCNQKFVKRFHGVEQDIKQQGLEMSDASLEQMEASWNNQKLKERA